MTGWRRSAVVLAFSTAISCTGTGIGGPPGGGGNSMLDTDTYGDKTDDDGVYEVFVDVGPDVTSFQITGSSDYYTSLEQLYDPSGRRVLYWEDWYYSEYSLTSAIFGYTKITAFDWPVRDVDGPLEQGEWRAVWSLVDDDFYYVPNEPVDVGIATKEDPDFSDATVSVQIVWADGVDNDQAVVDAIYEGVDVWREIWGKYGVALEEHYVTSNLDPSLPWAYSANEPEVARVADTKNREDLQLIVGDQYRNSNSLYGVAAEIPGTIEPTAATYVVLSWLTHAGRDGEFDADEIRLMGETMAHETGHYSGLFHPVEGGYDYWDALADTPECLNTASCQNQLATNLMYPYSVCGGGSCVLAEVLTDDQVGVLQRYIAGL